jgi:hypothetical protein
MATNLQQPFGELGSSRPRASRDDWRTARWLVGLTVVGVLLMLAALGSEAPAERTAPTIEQSVPSGAGEPPVFDGRGKWTGY